MATQVTYKDSQIASFANGTRILKTQGKYMEDDVTITADSGEASAIVITDEQDSHGGIIRHINAVTLTGDTVTPETLLSGYTAHDGTGQSITGTYTPSEAITLQARTNITPTESSQIITPDSNYGGLSSVQINGIDPGYVGSNVTRRTSSDMTASGATITAPAGYYENSASKTVASGTAGTPTAAKGTVSNHSITITPSVTNTTGYITGGTKTGTAVTVSASELVSGTKSISANGTGIDVTNYAAVNVAVSATTPNLQAKTNIAPSTSSQTITADSGYDGLSSVQINAMPTGTAGTPTATKGSVSNHSVTVTPSVTNTTGYITGGTKSGTGVTVSASELVSGSQTITSNGQTDVTNLASITVAIPIVTYYTGSSAPSSSLGQNGDIYLQS